MKKRILAPNQFYSGISAGVQFSNGVGEAADPHLIQWFAENGYRIEVLEENSSDSTSDGELNPVVSPGEVDSDNTNGVDQQPDQLSTARKAKR